MTTKPTENQSRRRQRDGGEISGKRMAVAESNLDHSKFVYRWINDEPSRMFALTKEDDWDLVPNDGVKDDAVDMNTAVSMIVGTKPDGSPLLAYLCRKLRTFYDEDQAGKSAALDEQIDELRRGNDRSGGSQSDYIPPAGIRIG